MERATGIIFRVLPVTESSLILNWLTLEHGRITTLAKGARRPNSPFRGKLDLFYKLELIFYKKRVSDLHLLKEVSVLETHSALRHSIAKITQASYCAQLVEKATEPGAPVPEIFNLFNCFLLHLCEAEAKAINVLAFELKLLGLLGLAPDLTASHLTQGVKRVAALILTSDWDFIRKIVLTPFQENELGSFLREFTRSQLGELPQTRSAALQGE